MITSKQIIPEEVRLFIQNNLILINRNAGEIEYIDKNGNNKEEGFSEDPYEAINKAILRERKCKLIVY